MQLNLSFANLPEPEDQLWEHLDAPLREATIDKLARLIAKAVAELDLRENNDD